jgi:spore coat protein U-like protein
MRRSLILTCLLILILGSAPSQMATTSTTLTVTATVSANCSVAAGTLAFGAYNPISSANVDQSGTFQLTCTKGTTATIGLDLGGHASGATRRMSNGTDLLAYEIYQDSGRTTVWGSSGGALLSVAAAPSNAAQTITAYGRISGSQDVGTGSYSDTVTVTVTF